MTDHEMRVNLCEAMGYHRCKKYRGSQSAPWMGPDGAYASTIPNPMDDDRDAALLRAWMVSRGFSLQIIITTDLGPDSAGVRVRVYKPSPDLSRDYSIAESWVWQQEEPDPLRRERLALCRSVLEALDTVDAGGTNG